MRILLGRLKIIWFLSNLKPGEITCCQHVLLSSHFSSLRFFPIIRPAWPWRDRTMVRGSVQINLCCLPLAMIASPAELESRERPNLILPLSFLFKQQAIFVYSASSSQSLWPSHRCFTWNPQIEETLFEMEFSCLYCCFFLSLWDKLSVERKEIIWLPVICIELP